MMLRRGDERNRVREKDRDGGWKLSNYNPDINKQRKREEGKKIIMRREEEGEGQASPTPPPPLTLLYFPFYHP